jgi:NAD+ kinase
VRRVGILLKSGKPPEAVEIAESLERWLTGRGLQVLVGADADREARIGQEVDLLVILGGDGTLLRGAALVAERGVPILGVNLGRLGFLTSCSPENAREALERALDGTLPLEERLRLRCELKRASGEVIVKYAANDAVVSQAALARLIEIEAFLDGKRITRYRADGLIVATPSGSTAYNLAAGGPIVTPDVRAVVVTPICPHTLTNRPVVAPSSSRINVRLGGQPEHVMLTVDGQWGTELRADDTLEISQAPIPLYLFRSTDGYFEVLTSKLQWGEREAEDATFPRGNR